jgi:hypothetical protein
MLQRRFTATEVDALARAAGVCSRRHAAKKTSSSLSAAQGSWELACYRGLQGFDGLSRVDVKNEPTVYGEQGGGWRRCTVGWSYPTCRCNIPTLSG